MRWPIALIATLLLSPLSWAQPFRIGVILSQTGAASALGTGQLVVSQGLASRLQRVQRSPIELRFADDGSSPQGAVRAAQQLIDDGVHALVCCTTPSATQAVSGVSEQRGVMMLALTEVDLAAAPNWLFQIPPDIRRKLQSIVIDRNRRNQPRLAVMTLDNRLGDELVAILNTLLVPEAGMLLVAEERYPPNPTVLTPEALMVATRIPDSVIVWGLASDTALALQALRARGFEGEVIINPELLEHRAGIPLSRLDGALTVVSPAQVRELIGRDNPHFERLSELAGLLVRLARRELPLELAYIYDALIVLHGAAEVALTYGVPLSSDSIARSLLRDALISANPITGAAASYDFSERERVGALPSSLLLARIERGYLSPLP